MLKAQITQPIWVQIPQSARIELVKLFQLERDCNREMVGGQVRSDGYSNQQLSKITEEKLRELGAKGTDIFTLLNDLISRLDTKQAPAANQKEADAIRLDSLMEQFQRLVIDAEKHNLHSQFIDRVSTLISPLRSQKITKKK